MDFSIIKMRADVNWTFLERVDVNGELPFMTLEELIPELLKWQSSVSQEQESDFGVLGDQGRGSKYVSDHCSCCYLLNSEFPDMSR